MMRRAKRVWLPEGAYESVPFAMDTEFQKFQIGKSSMKAYAILFRSGSAMWIAETQTRTVERSSQLGAMLQLWLAER